ncbi:hypothetical protein RB653_008046 [Dictyostelium firmibasis]|uniref:EGF-like domain-containing protein n=1 Tax=Dictyostelium firmibasis TaxID=79012 RepID=A0AAN7YTQ4_9MYCE
MSYNNKIFLQSDFSCLIGVTSLSLNGFYLSSDFITSQNLPASITSLFLYASIGPRINGPVNPLLKSLTFSPNESLSNTIYFSNLKTVVTYTQSDYTSEKLSQFKYINDISTPLKVNSWSFIPINLPSLNNINLTGITFSYLGPNFDISSFSNFSTYKGVGSIYLFDSKNVLPIIPFPPSLLQLTDNVITRISFSMKFSTPQSLLSLSNLKSLSYLNIPNGGQLFQFNGEIPFDLETLPPTLISFLFSGSNLYAGLPNFKSFKNITTLTLRNNSISDQLPIWNVDSTIKTLDLSLNKLKGTLDESYCQLESLYISSNQLSGTIPTCFSCYFINLGSMLDLRIEDTISIDFTIGFDGNNFSNLNLYSDQPPCTTIVPNLRYDSTSGMTYLFGRDLGFGYDYVNSTQFIFILDVPSISYYAITSKPSIGFYIDFTFKFSSTVYRVSSNPYPPQINSISILNDLVIIDGTYFSYNTSIISIEIGGYNCEVLSSTFYQINCNLSTLSTLPPVVSGLVKVGSLTTLLPIPTLNNSVVDTNQCQSLFYCNLNGTCSNQQCICDSKHTGIDCLGRLCLKNCTVNEFCDQTVGECKCSSGWLGSTCQYADHYASSLLQIGDLISLYGWFGTIHNNITINIGSTSCINILASDKIINCTLLTKPNNGYQNVFINQNSIEWIGKNMFKYQEDIKTILCYQNCSGNGKCNTTIGSCTCNQGYSGFDCSSLADLGQGDNKEGQTSIGEIDENAVSTITNSKTSFEIMITKLVEQSINGDIIKEWDLKTNQWLAINDKNNANIFKFNQTLNETDCTIIYTIEQVNNTKEYSFAGYSYSIESGSLKMTISIENYPYSSTLNNLQIQMKSQVSLAISNNNDNDCNEKETQINSSINDNLLNYISIKKDGKQMYGRFLSLMLSDDRSTLMSTSIVSTGNESITLGLNLPYCHKCLIDPDFSVLLSSDFKSSCGNEGDGGRKSYVIPVAIVVSVFGVAMIVAVGFLIKKKKSSIEFKNRLKAINKT